MDQSAKCICISTFGHHAEFCPARDESKCALHGPFGGPGMDALIESQLARIMTLSGQEFKPGNAVTLKGDINAINAYVNAGCPEPESEQ